MKDFPGFGKPAGSKSQAGAGRIVGPRVSQLDLRGELEPPSFEAQLEEQACPNCGEPMLVGWGATCGKCKPALAAPKTIMLAASDVAGMLSMTLGWLVVLRTPDEKQLSGLLDLIDPITILTRAGGTAGASQTVRQVEFKDDYMSAGHAVIRKPQGFAKDAAFTIEDRKSPGPSANGTFINGRKLRAGEVKSLGDGDVVRVGTTELHFKSLWLPPAAK